jgi:hypothetical protein
MYKLHDDQGTIAEGSFKECVITICNWLGSQEAAAAYSKNERSFAKAEFYDALKVKAERVEALGFIIEKVDAA